MKIYLTLLEAIIIVIFYVVVYIVVVVNTFIMAILLIGDLFTYCC